MSGPASLLLISVAVPVVGFVVAVIARLIVRTSHHRPVLGWAASTLCGIFGAAIGGGLVAVVLGRPVRQVPVAVLTGAVAGTVLILAVADQIIRRRTSPPHTAAELITAGESSDVEFKSSARFNYQTGGRDPRLEQVIAASVAAFCNARGGTLLIGVADDATVLGLAEDYRLVKRPTRDSYQLWLLDLLTTALGSGAATAVAIEFDSIAGNDVCLIRVPPAPRPVFLRPAKQRGAEFVVRVGNSTRQLAGQELVEYAVSRWSRRALAGRSRWRTSAISAAIQPDGADPAVTPASSGAVG
jgi:uncharacterized membrane protein YeaQ/YmgE (transglycosylase-associated protein family)